MPGASAPRMQRHRERQRTGVRHVVLVEIRDEWLARLIETGWIDEAGAEDRSLVADVVEDLVDCYARGVLSPDPGRGRPPRAKAKDWGASA